MLLHDCYNRIIELPDYIINALIHPKFKKCKSDSKGANIHFYWDSPGIKSEEIRRYIIAGLSALGLRYKFGVTFIDEWDCAMIYRIPGQRPPTKAMLANKPRKPLTGFATAEEEVAYALSYRAWREQWQGKRIPYTTAGHKPARTTKYDFNSLNVGDERLYHDTNKKALRVAFSAWRKKSGQPQAKLDLVEIDETTLLVSRVR